MADDRPIQTRSKPSPKEGWVFLFEKARQSQYNDWLRGLALYNKDTKREEHKTSQNKNKFKGDHYYER